MAFTAKKIILQINMRVPQIWLPTDIQKDTVVAIILYSKYILSGLPLYNVRCRRPFYLYLLYGEVAASGYPQIYVLYNKITEL